MNKAFKVIWNHATQSWTAVSEIARAKGKTKSVKSAKTAIALAVATAGMMASTEALAATAATVYNDGQTVISGSGVPNGGSVPVNYQVYVETRPSNVNGGGSVLIGETATVADGRRNGVAIGKNTTI